MMPYSFGKWQGISLYAQSHRHGWTIDIEYDSTLYSMTYTLYIWLDIPTTKAFIYLVMDHCVCVGGGGKVSGSGPNQRHYGDITGLGVLKDHYISLVIYSV